MYTRRYTRTHRYTVRTLLHTRASYNGAATRHYVWQCQLTFRRIVCDDCGITGIGGKDHQEEGSEYFKAPGEHRVAGNA